MALDRKIFEAPIRVRFAETDQMGIVHHASYLIYFEVGRVELSRSLGVSYAALEEVGFSLAVSEVQLRYKAAATFDQQLIIRTWLERLGSRGMTVGYEVVDKETGEVLTTGETRHICVDHSGKVSRLPEWWLTGMRKGLNGG